MATHGGDTLVVARAGSGKTRTLIARAIFLQKHCRVVPQELLLLAFNKKAADEMRNRLAKHINGCLPHVMTFHALAYALVHPDEELLFDDPNSDQLGLSREVQEVIDEHLRSVAHRDQIRDLMLTHFRDDWERIVDGRFQLTIDEFLAHRRTLPRESLKGDYVKSFGEKLIANTLFEHGVEYRYERNFRWDDFNYRPDFTIPLGPKGGVIIEYFGLQGDTDYDDIADKKRAFWAGHDEWKFLEFIPRDIVEHGVETFVDTLIKKLREAGIPCQRLPEEEIWERIRARALDSFTAAMKAFISRCRKRNLSTEDLCQMAAAHKSCSIAEELFLDVGVSVYQGYTKRLAETQKDDFDGLMWRSVALIRNGQTSFVRDKGRERGDVGALRFVMIDEFQDFSPMFFGLIDAIRSINPRAQCFCVGDDWQAINAFAGSDISYFENFERDFQRTSRCYIRTNHRSFKKVVDAGNALMNGLGVTAEAEKSNSGWVRLGKLDTFRPSAPEQARHNGDEITPALLRVIRNVLDRGLDVAMLSRRNGMPWYVNYSEDIMRTPDELSRFLEHVRSLRARERRLFYVAITRAEDSLVLLTETPAQSPYIAEIQARMPIDSLAWKDLSPVPSLDGARYEIRVFGAFSVKDQLRNLKYRWDAAVKCWRRAVMSDRGSGCAGPR